MSDKKSFYDLEKRIMNTIQTIPDAMGMLSDVARILGESLSGDRCLIIVGMDEQQSFEFVSWTAKDIPRIPSDILPELMSQPWVNKLTQKPNIGAIANLSKATDKILSKRFRDILVGSLLGIGTTFHGKVNGIIVLAKSDPYQWTVKEKELLKNLENSVAIACHLLELKLSATENLTDNTMDSNLSLTRIPKVLEENPILKLWWQATRKQLDQQLQWNKQLIHNIITIMSDQTRNPLASIKMGITMLRHKEFPHDVLQKRLDVIEEEWGKLNGINEEILQLKILKSEQLTLNPTSVNLRAFIEELITTWEQQKKNNKRQFLTLEISFDDPQESQTRFNSTAWELDTDPNHLRQILLELFKNAEKFSIPHSSVFLNITRQNSHDHSQTVITLKNLSPCFCREHLRDFFEPFYREQWVIDNGIPGIGLGLTIVKELVELLKGKIEITKESTDNPENCIIVVRLILPQSSF